MSDFPFGNDECFFCSEATENAPCWGELKIVDDIYDIYDPETNDEIQIWACEGHADLTWPKGVYLPKTAKNSYTEEATLTDQGPSVRYRKDGWYWADETWDWHGPWSSEQSATKRQALYCKYYLEGPEDRNDPGLVSREAWRAAKDRDSERDVHPCDCYEPWDCMCSGACGCHFKNDTNLSGGKSPMAKGDNYPWPYPKPITCAGESIRTCMAQHVRDWSADRRDAWLWGIVFGWEGCWESIAKQHRWTDETVSRLKQLHEQFKKHFPKWWERVASKQSQP